MLIILGKSINPPYDCNLFKNTLKHRHIYVCVCPYKYICEHVAIKCIFYRCIHRHNRKLNTPIYHQYLLQEGGILFFFPLHYSAFFNLNLFLPQLYLRYNILQVQGLVQAPGTISSSPQISFLLLTFMTTSARENN